MITGYVGTPGSGKSYEAVLRIIETLVANLKKCDPDVKGEPRVIYSNIDGLDVEKNREYMRLKVGCTRDQLDEWLIFLTKEQMQDVSEHVTPGSLIIIDEVHKLFSNREWASPANKKFCEWASTHRHDGNDVLLITQDIDKIDKHARTLIDWTYFYKKIQHFGSLVQLKYIMYAYDSDNHHGKPVAQRTMTYDKTVFPCYSSYNQEGMEEIGIQKNVNLLKHPIIYAVPVIIGVFVYFLSQSSLVSGDIFGAEKIASRNEQKTLPETEKKPEEIANRVAPVGIEKPVKVKKPEIPRNMYCRNGVEPKSRLMQAYDYTGTTILYYLSDGSTYSSNTGEFPLIKDSSVNITGSCVLIGRQKQPRTTVKHLAFN